MARRIAVVGAGIAGLATAVGLQQRGHHVTVAERRTDTSTGAGISIWPNALAALDFTDGVRIHVSDATVRTAEAVVGAHGTHSMVARHVNGPLRQRYAGYTAWRGIAAYDLDPGLAGETLGPGVETGHVPLGPHRQPTAGLPRCRPEPRHRTDPRAIDDGTPGGDCRTVSVRIAVLIRTRRVRNSPG